MFFGGRGFYDDYDDDDALIHRMMQAMQGSPSRGEPGLVIKKQAGSLGSPGPIRSIHSHRELVGLIQEASRSGKPVIVDYTASWCPPSRAIAPLYAQLAEQHGDRVLFAKVDDD